MIKATKNKVVMGYPLVAGKEMTLSVAAEELAIKLGFATGLDVIVHNDPEVTTREPKKRKRTKK